ncbi:MAG: hypothetical protein H0U50_08690 [Pyrinomonadaceae bacterium]|nr:hypothetical protein [Pyrinomonadaceae bacterium]
MRKNNTVNNFRLILLAFIVGVFVFGNVAEAQTKRPKKKPTKQMTKQMNDKIEYAPDADLFKEMQAQVTIVESKKDWKQFNRQSPTINKSGSRSAYIAQFGIEEDKEAMIDVIVVYEKSSDKFYEIRGFDFPRPFDELKWTSDDVLEFEQWVNPHNGGRYAINLRTGKIVAAGYLRNN